VCEVGAGVGLAGFVLASNVECSRVLITDGNDTAVNNILHNIERMKNRPQGLRTTVLEGTKLLWDRKIPLPDDLYQKFHFVIAADCLFLENFHEDLLYTIFNLLVPGGEALILAPQRKGSLIKFLDKAKAQLLSQSNPKPISSNHNNKKIEEKEIEKSEEEEEEQRNYIIFNDGQGGVSCSGEAMVGFFWSKVELIRDYDEWLRQLNQKFLKENEKEGRNKEEEEETSNNKYIYEEDLHYPLLVRLRKK
jgi:predicted nicotinamide N-methyase